MEDLSSLLKSVKKGVQGTETAPQGTATAPQGTVTAPMGDVAHSGAQADIILQDGKVLKIYKPGSGFNAAVLSLVKQLNGKGYLVDLYDYGTMEYEGEQRQFELMEYCPEGAVSGVNLKGDAETILKIAVETALAIDACHNSGFIHKDVKPANILIRDRKTWKCVLCDFGIADILDRGKVSTKQARTPIYAAPEMYERTATIGNTTYCELTPAADFYSLGMTILCLWYGESAFNNKETTMAIQKVHDGIIVPAEMPEPLRTITRGLLVKDPSHRWGLKEMEDCIKGKKAEVNDERKAGGLNIVFNSSRHQVAHSPKELAAFMAADMNLAIKYLYSGKISKWLEPMPELQVEMENIVERDFVSDQQMGCLAAIHTLNPFYDLKFCCDLNDPNYAMTGEAIGRLLNEVYYHYFTKEDADGVDIRIAESFANGGNRDYVPWFLDHKGNRFIQHRKWFDYCMTQTGGSKKKAGPSDANYLHQVAMMKTIAGFGAVPEYRLSRTGEVLRSLDDFHAASQRELQHDLRSDLGLRGWLAVQCHENPNANLKPKYAYEKLLEQYLNLIGDIDSDDLCYQRFIQARSEAKGISADAKGKIRAVWTHSLIQKVLVAVLAFLPMALLLVGIVLNIIDNPTVDVSLIRFQAVFYSLGLIVAAIAFFKLDEDGCLVPIILGAIASGVIWVLIKFLGQFILWIYGLVVLVALVLFSFATLFQSSPFRQKAKAVMKPGFEELTLEPLFYAFSNESHFDSSLNGTVDASSIDFWKDDVRSRWKTILLFIGTTLVLLFFRFFLPSSERMDRFDRKLKHGMERAVPNDTTHTVEDTVNMNEIEQETI